MNLSATHSAVPPKIAATHVVIIPIAGKATDAEKTQVMEKSHALAADLKKAGLSVVVDDGRVADEVRLDRPDLGLLIPPGVWGVQYKFQPGSVLAVFACVRAAGDGRARAGTDLRAEEMVLAGGAAAPAG